MGGLGVLQLGAVLHVALVSLAFGAILPLSDHDTDIFGTGENARIGKRAAIADTRFRWTNGVIPYDFLPGHYNHTEVEMVKQAMQLWEDGSCLDFRPATPADKNKVTFKGGNVCYSMIGMVGGRQYVTLGRAAGCRKLGLAIHEIGHTIGLVHEHQLPNRDQYIRVHAGNAVSGTQREFEKLKPEEVNTYGVPYDITSIMHYGKYAMAGNSDWKTIEAVDNSKNYMIVPVAEKKKMSFSDIKVVNLMYNCSAHCAPDSSCKNPGFLDKNCKCIQPKYVEYCKNKDAKCEKWKANGQCQSAKTFMEMTCPISCGICKPRDGLTAETFPTEPPKKIDCSGDKNPSCQMWADNNQCTANKVYMDDECPVTCGLCGEKPKKPQQNKPCVNTFDEARCEKWSKRGECRTNASFMKKQCAKSCGICQSSSGSSEGGKPGEQSGTTGGVACQNTYNEAKCEKWAKRGECKTNASFMTHSCAKSCGTCSGSSKTEGMQGDQPETASSGGGDCTDFNPRMCQGWKGLGYCRTNKYTMDNCRKTCNRC